MKRRRYRRGDNSIRVFGHDYPICDRLRIGPSTYLILDQLGNAGRQRLMAFDPDAGFDGELRTILVLPRSRAGRQHGSVFRRLPPKPVYLPAVIAHKVQHDRIVLVLEWIHGTALDKQLADIRRGHTPAFSVYLAFRYFSGLAHGLSQLHQRCQIHHGDIKPANLILARDPGRLVPIDFGSAWLSERTANRDEGDGVSPVYSAPELQTQKRLVDFRADQFSASVVLYEMLTMELPYGLGGKAGLPQYIQQTRGKLIPPSIKSPDWGNIPKYIWNGIDRIVETGLQFDADDRFASPSEWRDGIDSVLADLKGRSHLGPINKRMTAVVGWLFDRFSTS